MGVNITTIVYLRVLIIQSLVNHYFNGGGSPGQTNMPNFVVKFTSLPSWKPSTTLHILDQEDTFTPPKINMEPGNDGFQ